MATKQELLNREYGRIRRNYLRNIRRMEQEGLRFSQDMRPKIPKRITKGSIRKLERMNTPEYRYGKVFYIVDPETGEYLGKVKDAKKAKRSLAAKKGWKTRKANQARHMIDVTAGAINASADALDDADSSMYGFYSHIERIMDMIVEKAAKMEDYAINAAAILESGWADIQRALNVMERYANPDEVPYWCDRIIEVLRDADGSVYTQEDARIAGSLEESVDPDYYPS